MSFNRTESVIFNTEMTKRKKLMILSIFRPDNQKFSMTHFFQKTIWNKNLDIHLENHDALPSNNNDTLRSFYSIASRI